MTRSAFLTAHRHDFPALDGLRGFAVLLVLLVHTAGAMYAGIPSGPVHDFWSEVAALPAMGGTGVHLFFVLSGYLLFLPFARRLLAGGPEPDTIKFYKRRLLRILPAYYAALLFVWLVFERHTVRNTLQQLFSHIFLVHNYSVITFKGLDGPTWTMAVEAQFYALLPLVGAASVWLLSRGSKWLLFGAAVLLLSSPVASAANVVLQHAFPSFKDHGNLLAPFTFMTTFGCGIIAACLYVLAQAGKITPARQRMMATAGLIVFAVIFGAYELRQVLGLQRIGWDYYTFAAMMGYCYAGLLLHVVFSPGGRVALILSRPVVRFIGDISFSVYLLHQPILIGWLVPWARQTSGLWPLLIVALGLVLVVFPLAIVSYLLIERPFLRRKLRDDSTEAMPHGRQSESRRRLLRTRRLSSGPDQQPPESSLAG